MKFETLLKSIRGRGWFDLPTAVQLSGEPRHTLLMQLYRWCKAGKLIPLRRGMYAFAEEYRRQQIQPAEIANRIYTPSYLSLQWALSYHGLIPEMAVAYTSVTTRQTKRFQNKFGTFSYRHLKQEYFFGYERVDMTNRTVLLAKPEKALLDLWYIEPGEWTAARMKEMRFQNFEVVNGDRLARFAERFASPRLHRAVQAFEAVAAYEKEGTIEL